MAFFPSLSLSPFSDQIEVGQIRKRAEEIKRQMENIRGDC